MSTKSRDGRSGTRGAASPELVAGSSGAGWSGAGSPGLGSSGIDSPGAGSGGAGSDTTAVCFEGPSGTSDERAVHLLRTLRPGPVLPMASVAEVCYTVDHTPGLVGIVPVETSVDGLVTTMFDRLMFGTERVLVREEVVLVERIGGFCLGDPSEIDTVLSHPDIIKLCRGYIVDHQLTVEHTVSTAAACERVVNQRSLNWMALAPLRVGEAAGLVKLDESVSDVPDIRTRYFAIGQEVAAATGADRSCLLVIPPEDRAGTLSVIAECFGEPGVNLLGIMSRPLGKGATHHAFYLTCEGHALDGSLQGAFERLLNAHMVVKLLGSYPAWPGEEVTAPFQAGSSTTAGAGKGEAANALRNPPVASASTGIS